MKMEDRKRCVTCGEYLIAFQGHYLHPEKPCNGLLDFIEIEAVVAEPLINDKFVKLYGAPEIDDSERATLLEEELTAKEELLKHPVIRFLLRIIKKRPPTA